MISFEAFIAAVHGSDRRPYPWQQRLAHAFAGGEVPEWITTPTGSGKTGAIDAAVWALASQAERKPPERTVGVRLIWAVDRRLLVDEVFEQAAGLANRLHDAVSDESAELHEVAARLLALAANGRWQPGFDSATALAEGHEPLSVARWRGGVPASLDRRSPFQPTVITSTVQQVGSRLLFRGYGVSNRSRSLEAALVAQDAVVFLDEAHLAAPFAQTVASVIRYQREQPREQIVLPPRLQLVTLTATPPPSADLARSISLERDDLEDEALSNRLRAPKRLRTVEGDAKPAEQLAALAVQAVDAGAEGAPAVVAVVANRVRVAVEVRERLVKAFAKRDDAPTVALLVGPQRPVDRRRQLEPVAPVLFDGVAPEGPVVVVATQTFEVGLDADVSHLVTQSASVSAVVQRIGRVNRQGRREAGEVTVVRDEGFPLYASDEPAAWEWLQAIEKAGGDVSVLALREYDRPEQLAPPRAPSLTDLIVQQLAQTSFDLPPLQEPDVDGLLRGAHESIDRDVTAVWRGDLGSKEDDQAFSSETLAYRRALIRLAPPQAAEAIALPIAAVKALIAAERGAVKPAYDGPDLPVGGPDGASAVSGVTVPFVVVRGREVLAGVPAREPRHPRVEKEITPSEIRPGDTVVLGVEAGGVDDAGLRPGVAVATESHLECDAVEGPELPYVRLTRGALTGTGGSLWSSVAARLQKAMTPSDEVPNADREPRPAEAWLSELRAAGVGDEALEATLGESWWAPRKLGPPVAADEGQVGEPAGWVLCRADQASPEARLDPSATAPPTLTAHCAAVGERAGRWAEEIDGSPELGAVRLAGLAHDLGKADPRIQAWFAGGRRRVGEPLAKSEFGTADPARSRAAARAAGMPRGLRHEIASVAGLNSALEAPASSELAAGRDLELARHLVGTHHGWGRPRFPQPEGGAPALPFAAMVEPLTGSALGDGLDGWEDGGWEQRFWALHDRYGPWAVAYLEALVVLADRNVSKEGK